MKKFLSGIKLSLFLLIIVSVTACMNVGNGTNRKEKTRPELIYTGMASPDIIALTIRAQWVEHGKQLPYEKLPGDSIVKRLQHRFVVRNGEMIGSLAGREGKIITPGDRIYGDTLETVKADNRQTYRISGDEGEIVPQTVYRKSKPVDFTRAPTARETSPMEHSVMLKLSESLVAGKKYTIHFPEGWLTENKISFVYDPSLLRSEAVHVNQVGYRPDDPVKLAFLSFWMGNGGGLEYPDGNKFSLIEVNSGKEVFTGKTALRRLATDSLSKTYADIHELDFSGFSTPGVYRISVDGVGCSFSFSIDNDAWKNAFIKSMRGLYCQRSGIVLGPPYSPFVRPRGFHPDDGVKVYVSEPPVEGEDPALRVLNPELKALVESFEPESRFKPWVQNLKNVIVPNGWGGYMDAGDWDRRADHALMPLMMFDLAEMFPDKFSGWTFNIPESGDDLPDLINEALWEVDFLKRMQQADGSVYGAIESGSHPRRGETSWQESLPIFAYARTKSAAYNYVADGARAALWFKNHGMQDKSSEYLISVLKSFEWAENQPEESGRGFGSDRGAGARCLAAAEMYRLTGEEKYQKIFVTTTRFSKSGAPFYTSPMGPNGDAQGEAGWTYLRTTHPGINKEIQQNIRNAMISDAERMVQNCELTDFHWAGGPARQMRWGALSMPESHVLCRAHFITGDKRYLIAIIKSTLSGTGANPVNMAYVTGVGSRAPLILMHEDALITGQTIYEGITVGGPYDIRARNSSPNLPAVERLLYPMAKEWPATESFFDVFRINFMNEFTVHQTMLPTSFVWGYLAARE